MARRVLRTGPLDSGSFARRHVRRIGTDAVRARAQIWAARLLGGRRQYSRSGPVDRGHTDADHFPAERAAADAATAADGLLSVRVRRGDRVVILAAVRRLDGSGHDRPLGPRTPGYAALTRHGLDPQLAHRHPGAHSDRLAELPAETQIMLLARVTGSEDRQAALQVRGAFRRSRSRLFARNSRTASRSLAVVSNRNGCLGLALTLLYVV